MQKADDASTLEDQRSLMSTAETIMQLLKSLPDSLQREVLNFVEFLQSRQKQAAARGEDRAWSQFSLASAMRGMEDEDSPYSLDDLKETFR